MRIIHRRHHDACGAISYRIQTGPVDSCLANGWDSDTIRCELNVLGVVLEMRQASASKIDLREALALGAALVGYSNGIALWAERRGSFPDGVFRVLNPLLVALMLTYAARRPGGLAAVGLRRAGLGRSLVGGLGVGLGLAAPALFFFYRPLLLDTP